MDMFATRMSWLHHDTNFVVLFQSVAIGNRERHMRKASHCGSKQQ